MWRLSLTNLIAEYCCSYFVIGVQRVNAYQNYVQHINTMACEAIDYVLGSWCAHPDGTGVAAEYLFSVESIAVLPELMHSSDTRAQLQILCSGLGPTSATSFETTLVSAIKKATGARSDSAARRAVGALPGILDMRCGWYDEIQLYCQGLSWEQPYLYEALARLTSSEDESGLLIVLAMLARAARECAARKRATFSTIINRVTKKDERSSDHSSKLHPALAIAPEAVKAAAQRVHNICSSVIADTKDRAFDSTFMQPTLMFATMRGDESVLVDADVHGAPTYLALLEATTGIRTSRLLELDDDAKGTIEFPTTWTNPALQALWAAENLGKSWRAVKECKGSVPMFAVTSNAFIFPNREGWSGYKSIRSMVDGALADTRENTPRRGAFAKFVAQYCSYFKAEVLLPRLFTAVLNGTIDDAAGGCGSPDTYSAAVEQVFQFLKDNDDAMSRETCTAERGDGVLSGFPPAARVPSDCDSVRCFLWDVESYPPVFNIDAARRLFAAVGVVKPHGWVPDATPKKVAVPAHASASNSSRGLIIPKTSIRLTAAGDARGGGTGREHLHNLFNDGIEPWNKWLHPGYVAQSWVQADFLDGKHVITAYGLCSANDSPHRDPIAWRLLGKASPSDSSWRVLHEFPQPTAAGDGGRKASLRGVPTTAPVESSSAPLGFMARWQWLWFDVHDTEPVCAVKLEITRVRAPGDCLQLGHFHLQGV
jgi:hypothetical protein